MTEGPQEVVEGGESLSRAAGGSHGVWGSGASPCLCSGRTRMEGAGRGSLDAEKGSCTRASRLGSSLPALGGSWLRALQGTCWGAKLETWNRLKPRWVST